MSYAIQYQVNGKTHYVMNGSGPRLFSERGSRQYFQTQKTYYRSFAQRYPSGQVVALDSNLVRYDNMSITEWLENDAQRCAAKNAKTVKDPTIGYVVRRKSDGMLSNIGYSNVFNYVGHVFRRLSDVKAHWNLRIAGGYRRNPADYEIVAVRVTEVEVLK